MNKYEVDDKVVKRIAMKVLLLERQLNKNENIKKIDVVKQIKRIIDNEVK